MIHRLKILSYSDQDAVDKAATSAEAHQVQGTRRVQSQDTSSVVKETPLHFHAAPLRPQQEKAQGGHRSCFELVIWICAGGGTNMQDLSFFQVKQL